MNCLYSKFVLLFQQEIAAMKAKLRNANEKIYVFEAKEKKQVKVR